MAIQGAEIDSCRLGWVGFEYWVRPVNFFGSDEKAMGSRRQFSGGIVLNIDLAARRA